MPPQINLTLPDFARCDGGQKTRDRRIAQMPTPGGAAGLSPIAAGFHGHGGTPIAGWFVSACGRENPIEMDDWE